MSERIESVKRYRYEIISLVTVLDNEDNMTIASGASPQCIINNFKVICWILSVEGSNSRDAVINQNEQKKCFLEINSAIKLNFHDEAELEFLSQSQLRKFENGEKYSSYAVGNIIRTKQTA